MANVMGYEIEPRADLRGAYLRRADLRKADLQWAYLQGADLRGADLQEAYLQEAYLQWADLRGADLQGAYLQGAYLRGAMGIPPLNCPETGQFTVYKKLKDGLIARLEVPADAQRSTAATRKIRVSEALVVEIVDEAGVNHEFGASLRDDGFLYRVGEVVKPLSPFDPDRWNECASGIHCFLTLQEAVDW